MDSPGSFFASVFVSAVDPAPTSAFIEASHAPPRTDSDPQHVHKVAHEHEERERLVRERRREECEHGEGGCYEEEARARGAGDRAAGNGQRSDIDGRDEGLTTADLHMFVSEYRRVTERRIDT